MAAGVNTLENGTFGVDAAAQNGWLDERACMTEALTALARAGADAILTYAALDYAGWWREGLS